MASVIVPSLRVSAAILMAAGLAACSTIDGPASSRLTLVLAPSYQGAGSVGVTADRLRVVVRPEDTAGAGTANAVADTTVAIDPETGEASVDVDVPLPSVPATFVVRVEAVRSADGVVLFAGEQTVVVSGPDGPTEPVSIPVTYVGPAAARLTLAPRDTSIQDGESFTFTATVFNAQDDVIDVPVVFALADPTATAILSVDEQTGAASAPAGASGVASVIARTLDTEPAADTATVLVGGVSDFVTDPEGDTFETSASDGLVPPDIVRFGGEVRGSELVLQLDFANPVASQLTSDTARYVVGLIDFDVDQNPETGTTANTDAFGGQSGLGMDYFISLFVVDSLGQVEVINAADFTFAGFVTPEFSGNTIVIPVPLSVIGNDDGQVNLATVLGTLPEPTDIAPDSGHVAIGSSAAAPPPRSAGPPAGENPTRWGHPAPPRQRR